MFIHLDRNYFPSCHVPVVLTGYSGIHEHISLMKFEELLLRAQFRFCVMYIH